MLKEPVIIAGRNMKFIDFEPLKSLIKIEELSNNSSSYYYGYREGYYIDDAKFQSFMGTSYKDKDFTLMYFWASFCVPCIKEIPSTKQLYADIKDDSVGEMLIIPGVVREKEYLSTVNAILKHDFSESLEPMTCASSLDKFITDDNICGLLKMNSFPTFILINKEGKILYRDHKKLTLEEIREKVNAEE